jgi:TolA-binding protein
MIPLSRSVAAAVIGGMMLAPAKPAAAASPTPVFPVPSTPVVPIQADDKTEVTELKKQVEDSNRKLAAIQKQLEQLTEVLTGKKDETGTPLTSDRDRGLVAQMRDLKDRLAQIEKDLAAYKTQTALKPTVETPKATKGTVRIVNEYPVQISIVVNGTSYRIAPSKTQDVDVPAGEFSYQLLESGGAVTKSTIKDKETVTLRIK